MAWGAAIVGTAATASALCYFVPRPPVVAAATLVWPLVYLGLDRGWWGAGLGDGWPLAAASLTAAALAGSLVGLLARGRSGAPATLPTHRGDGLRPGSDLNDSAGLADVMDEPRGRS